MNDFPSSTNEPQPTSQPSEPPLQPEMRDEPQHQMISQSRPEPWGIWATMGWAILIGIVFSLAQAVVVAVFTMLAYRDNPRLDGMQLIKDFESNGLLLSIAVCASSLASAGLTILAARLRWPGTVGTSRTDANVLPEVSATATPLASNTWRDYLALHPVSSRTLLVWSGVVCLFAIASDTLTSLLGRPIVPEFMQKAYATAQIVPLLWIAFIIFAPVFEELFFRGFLFRGLFHTKLGAAGTIVITSLLWAVIHIQYDAYGIFSIFIVGLLLGWARVRTNSIYPCIAMHCLMNFIATTEAALQHAGIMK
ncbi:MAG TPA: CPBP family intramembrane glutamic endopeptidase [Abditibacteriaceae bacterium]|nr:CPBP family intramembrane glutamic endopeptidase [Abditibacteriaceae bacterium]